jgi:hypothetical protein
MIDEASTAVYKAPFTGQTQDILTRKPRQSFQSMPGALHINIEETMRYLQLARAIIQGVA